MPSVHTLGPTITLITATSGAVCLATGVSPVSAFLLQNQGSITVYLGGSATVATSAAIQIAAGASYNPDKHQTRDDRQPFGLDNYFVSTRQLATAVTAVCALIYHEILDRSSMS